MAFAPLIIICYGTLLTIKRCVLLIVGRGWLIETARALRALAATNTLDLLVEIFECIFGGFIIEL
jgi:hypothetical protein